MRTLPIAACAAACLMTIVLLARKHPFILTEAPSWVRAQQARHVKMSLIDKLESDEKHDQATIAAVQQRLHVVSERNKWLTDKYKALKAYKGLRSSAVLKICRAAQRMESSHLHADTCSAFR